MAFVKAWLETLGLAQYADAFVQADIDKEALRDLTEEDLKSLGVTLGHRKRLLRAIAGLPVTQPAARVLAPTAGDPATVIVASSSKPETRQVSALFCDLVGSTALARRLDAEDLHAVLQAYYRCCTNLVARFGGSIAHSAGDGLLARFGYPQAHEDDAERAIRCGLDMTDAVSRLTHAPSVRLQARIGIATGRVVVGDQVFGTPEQATTGDAPNLAARLQTLAQPSQVVVDKLTRQLATAAFTFVDLGQHELKGFTEPITAWRVSEVRNDPSRFAARHSGQLTEMVGREHELGLLLHRWGEATSGEGRIALLVGEAGIGKSRLLAAFLEHLPDGTHIPLWQCSPYHSNTALFPALDQLMRSAGVTVSIRLLTS